MGKINSKQKGKQGELELKDEINKYGFETRRSVQFNGKAEEGQPDLIGLPNIHIECKRVEKLNIDTAMEQAIRDSENDKTIPCVFHRKNRKRWLVTMTLEDWFKLYKKEI